MKRSRNIFVITGLFAALIGCAPRSDSDKAIADARKASRQATRDAQETAYRAKRAGEIAAAAGRDAKGVTLDISASGGQPGKVELFGGLSDSNGQLIKNVTVTLQAGKSWKGERPRLEDKLKLTVKLAETSKKSLANLEKEQTYLNLGCPSLAASNTAGLTKAKGAQFSAAAVVSARRVFICGNPQLTAEILFIDAKELVLMDAELKSEGGLETMLHINANEIKLIGANVIAAKGSDGKSTSMDGPSLSLSANKVSGSGTLSIISEGASYVEAAK